MVKVEGCLNTGAVASGCSVGITKLVSAWGLWDRCADER